MTGKWQEMLALFQLVFKSTGVHFGPVMDLSRVNAASPPLIAGIGSRTACDRYEDKWLDNV